MKHIGMKETTPLLSVYLRRHLFKLQEKKKIRLKHILFHFKIQQNKKMGETGDNVFYVQFFLHIALGQRHARNM